MGELSVCKYVNVQQHCVDEVVEVPNQVDAFELRTVEEMAQSVLEIRLAI